jgi:hypothetical protein
MPFRQFQYSEGAKASKAAVIAAAVLGSVPTTATKNTLIPNTGNALHSVAMAVGGLVVAGGGPEKNKKKKTLRQTSTGRIH